jgi:hypothetical protein
MMLEQSTKNTGIILNNIFHKTIWHLKTVVRFIMIPWIVLFFIIMVGLLDELFTGELGHNGGMTGLFQDIGLYPHTTYVAFLWITGIGVFFATARLLWCVVVALFEAAARQMQKAGLKEWIMRKTAPLRNAIAHFEKAHPNVFVTLLIASAIAGMVFFTFLAMSPTPRNKMIVWPPDGPQIIQASPYSSVLLRVPNYSYPKANNTIMIHATHTISGKAVVTQTGPHTYQVRMIP